MPTPPPTPAAPRFWFFNPYVQIALCVAFGSAAEVLLKKGATATANLPTAVQWLGLTGLSSGWTWLSIVCTLVSFFAWMSAIRVLPLGVAFSLTNGVQVIVALSSWWFLGEGITPKRWCGIVLVVAGLTIVARPYAKLDERL